MSPKGRQRVTSDDDERKIRLLVLDGSRAKDIQQELPHLNIRTIQRRLATINYESELQVVERFRRFAEVVNFLVDQGLGLSMQRDVSIAAALSFVAQTGNGLSDEFMTDYEDWQRGIDTRIMSRING